MNEYIKNEAGKAIKLISAALVRSMGISFGHGGGEELVGG
jgi:hypothetical protein